MNDPRPIDRRLAGMRIHQPEESSPLPGTLRDPIDVAQDKVISAPPRENVPTLELLKQIKDYHPDIAINCVDDDQLSFVRFVNTFSTGHNSISRATPQTNLQQFQFAFELGSKPFYLRDGEHNKTSRQISEYAKGLPEDYVYRILLELDDSKEQFNGFNKRDAVNSNAIIAKWPDAAHEVLNQMLWKLENDPRTKFIPKFKEHLEWLERKVVSRPLNKELGVVRYPQLDEALFNQFDKIIFIEASPEEKSGAPKVALKTDPGHVLDIYLRDGSLYVYCGGCADERQIVPLKGNDGHGCLVIGAQCPNCKTAYAPGEFVADENLRDSLKNLKF